MDSFTYANRDYSLLYNRERQLIGLPHSLGECRFEPFGNIARLVLDKLPEASGDVRLCDMDVIPGGHRWHAIDSDPIPYNSNRS